MASDFRQRLQLLEERFQQGVAEFKETSREFDKTLAAAREKYPPMTAEQQERLAEHYRGGNAGPELREIQAKVDRGEITWDEIRKGSRDPELTERYYAAMADSKGGQLLRAAANGEPIERYLPEDPDDEDSVSDDDYFEVTSQVPSR